MKKKHLALWLMAACMALCLVFSAAPADAASRWRPVQGEYYKGSYVYYIYRSGNTQELRKSPVGPHSMGVHTTMAAWHSGEVYVTIAHAYGSNLYLSVKYESGKVSMLRVNAQTGKKKTVAKKCAPLCGSGKYIYGQTSLITDTSASPVNIWKVTGSGVKKVKTLGKRIFGTAVVGRKIYYASYKGNGMKNMTVYCCKANGSGRKKLFSLKAKGQYGQALIMVNADEKTITATRSRADGGTDVYTYSISSRRLKKQ